MDRLFFVTQVAPYVDGPAGVHGVLDQAAVGVAQVAELHGLQPQRVDDVRNIAASELHDARALALFTIGETPWSPQQRSAILDGVRVGAARLPPAPGGRPRVGARRGVSRTRNFSNWTYWRLRHESSVDADPCPLDDPAQIEPWRIRVRGRLDSMLGPAPEPVPLDL